MAILISGSVNTDVSSIFYATYGTTTYQEIVQAYNDGKFILVSRPLNGTTFYSLSDINSSGTYYFRTFSSAANTNYGCYITSDGTWSVNSYSYAALSSPSFTGTPTAPTAASGTNTTQIATTAFVQDAISNSEGAWTVVASIPISLTLTSSSSYPERYSTLAAPGDYINKDNIQGCSAFRWRYHGTISKNTTGSAWFEMSELGFEVPWSIYISPSTTGINKTMTICTPVFSASLDLGADSDTPDFYPATPAFSYVAGGTSTSEMGYYKYTSGGKWIYPQPSISINTYRSGSSITLNGTLYLEGI